jgi:putative tricarboxylic transport membrane protein
VGDAPPKAMTGGLIGLSLSTVGIDANRASTATPSTTLHLSDGIQFIVVVIGLFSVSEILLMLQSTSTAAAADHQHRPQDVQPEGAGADPGGPRCARRSRASSSACCPGAGATIASGDDLRDGKAAWRARTTQFGKGDIRGVAAPEAANNASANGSLRADADAGRAGFGHHGGDDRRAHALQHHARAGAVQEQPVIVWGLIASLFIANVMLLVHQHPAGPPVHQVAAIPNWLLVPGMAGDQRWWACMRCMPPPSTWS